MLFHLYINAQAKCMETFSWTSFNKPIKQLPAAEALCELLCFPIVTHDVQNKKGKIMILQQLVLTFYSLVRGQGQKRVTPMHQV